MRAYRNTRATYMINLQNAERIEGWMYPEELEFLAQSAQKSRAILEFGCYKGRSTRALADNLSDLQACQIVCVDPWKGPYYSNDGSIHGINPDVYGEFSHNLAPFIDLGIVLPYPCLSTDFLNRWLTDGLPKFDFIFIDGDHRYETVKHDISLAKRLATKNAIIAGHDYLHSDWPGVKEAVDECLTNVQFVNTIWWVKNANSPEDSDWCSSR